MRLVENVRCPNCKEDMDVRILDRSVYRPECSELSEDEWEKIKNERHKREAMLEPNASRLMYGCPKCSTGLNGHDVY